MKTSAFVMLFVLSAALAARASDGVNQDLTLIGSDEALLIVPELLLPIDLSLPPIDDAIPASGFFPLFLPPIGDWIRLPKEQFPLDLLEPQDPSPLPR